MEIVRTHEAMPEGWQKEIAAVMEVTRTEEILLHRGGKATFGQIVDDMIKDGATKIVLDLDPKL